MDSDAKTIAEVLDTLDRLNMLLAEKNEAIVDEFASEPDVVLIGSSAGEIARGPAALAVFFNQIRRLPSQLRWEWLARHVTAVGDVAWLFADGEVVIRNHDGEIRAPYRLTGVLQRREGRWRWRLFHGSEPAE